MNWLPLIEALDALNREMHSLMPPAPVAYAGPAPAGAEALIAAAETDLEVQLDPMHRDFLQYADGWPEFSGTISLLGSSELKASSLLDRGRKNLGYISWNALGRYRWKRRSLFIIGVSDATLDVICMPISGKKVQKQVIWFNNVEPDEYQDFEAFFKTILSFKPKSLTSLREKKAQRGDA